MELNVVFSLITLLEFISVSTANVVSEVHHPNVIIVHVENLHWSDLGIHVNRKDSENSTPNIDYLAYSGIILNRFYANGGRDSLLSGCYQRSQYGNSNLMTSYFERNGYSVNFIARNSYDKIESFESGVLDAIPSDSGPFLTVADFGNLGRDIKIAYVDEIVASILIKTHKLGVMNNTIILFLSLPDNNESPLEINIRRTAFVYSPLLKLQQRVSNQIIHVIDLLPTLVNASSLKWRTRDKIYIDGINQWQALNENDEERLSVYGDNFYISNYWKLSFGVNGSADSYGSIENQNMESDKNMSDYDFETYVRSIFASDVHPVLDRLSSQKVMFSRSRASVHCDLKDVDEAVVRHIKCSRSSPCLFDLLEDPCEFDNKHEHEFDFRRNHMRNIFERYLTGGVLDETSVRSINSLADTAAAPIDDDTMVGIILGGSVGAGIFIFVVVVCVKENCNRRRSVYHDKSKKNSDKSLEVKTGNGTSANGRRSADSEISVISRIEI